MRELKFRGKTEFNKWYIGDICTDYKGIQSMIRVPSFVYSQENICSNSAGYFRVIPETIGQETGLKDKNGKGIFEGDIVRTESGNKVVKFGRIGYDSGVGLTGFYLSDGEETNEMDFETGEKFHSCDRNVDLKQVEVIGNVWDNIELLSEK